MMDTIKEVATWALNIVAIAVGFFLIIRGLIDLASGVGGRRKELGTILWGVFIGFLGGLIGWVGADNILEFFKSNGEEIPLFSIHWSKNLVDMHQILK